MCEALAVGESRPPLSGELSGAQLQRWYWLKEELAGLARQLGISAGGGKQELTARLAAALDGTPVPAAEPARRPAPRPLPPGALSPETIIPAGHPGGSHGAALLAWQQYRARPVDGRAGAGAPRPDGG